MNTEILHDALNLLPGDLVTATDTLRAAPRKKSRHWMRFASMAACAALVLWGGWLFTSGRFSDKAAAQQEELASNSFAEAPMAAAPAESPAEAAPESASGQYGADMADLSQTARITVATTTGETVTLAGGEDIDRICSNLLSLQLRSTQLPAEAAAEYTLTFYDAGGSQLETVAVFEDHHIRWGEAAYEVTGGQLDYGFLAHIVDIALSAGPEPAE